MSNLGFLTRDQIITQGLQIGGNPGLAVVPAGYTESLPVTFIKGFLHHVYMTRDLRFMLTTATISTDGTVAYKIDLSTITRFRSIKSLRLVGLKEPLNFEEEFSVLNNKILYDLDQTPAATGIPTTYTITPDRSAIYVYPIPNQAYTGTLTFYKIPDVSALAANSIPDFEDSQALVQAVAMFARDYDKDTMVNLTERIAKSLFGEYRGALDDINRVKATSVRLSNFTFRYNKGD